MAPAPTTSTKGARPRPRDTTRTVNRRSRTRPVRDPERWGLVAACPITGGAARRCSDSRGLNDEVGGGRRDNALHLEHLAVVGAGRVRNEHLDDEEARAGRPRNVARRRGSVRRPRHSSPRCTDSHRPPRPQRTPFERTRDHRSTRAVYGCRALPPTYSRRSKTRPSGIVHSNCRTSAEYEFIGWVLTM
jgi:hypothetical protein